MTIEMDEVGAAPRKGETVALGTSAITFLVLGEETGGAYSALEYLAAPGAGSGLHTHRHEDESFYVVEGSLRFQLGEEVREVAAGEFVTIPVGTRHAFANAGSEPARAVIILRPAGLEGFFADMAALLAAYPAAPPAEAVLLIAAKYDLDFS